MDKLLKFLVDVSAVAVVIMLVATAIWVAKPFYNFIFGAEAVAEVVGEWQYWIEPGDTLSHLAIEHYPGRDWREIVYEIRQLNPGIDPGLMRVGQKIVMPEVE